MFYTLAVQVATLWQNAHGHGKRLEKKITAEIAPYTGQFLWLRQKLREIHYPKIVQDVVTWQILEASISHTASFRLYTRRSGGRMVWISGGSMLIFRFWYGIDIFLLSLSDIVISIFLKIFLGKYLNSLVVIFCTFSGSTLEPHCTSFNRRWVILQVISTKCNSPLDFYLSYSKNRNTELNVMVTGEPIFITDYTDSLGCVT